MVIVSTVRLNYASTNVGLSTWVQLQPVDGAGNSLSGAAPAYSMPAEVSEFDVFDSSGSTIEVGTGPAVSSVNRIALIPPGGPAYPVKTILSKGALTWVRAIDVAATGGELVVDFKHGRK